MKRDKIYKESREISDTVSWGSFEKISGSSEKLP